MAAPPRREPTPVEEAPADVPTAIADFGFFSTTEVRDDHTNPDETEHGIRYKATYAEEPEYAVALAQANLDANHDIQFRADIDADLRRGHLSIERGEKDAVLSSASVTYLFQDVKVPNIELGHHSFTPNKTEVGDYLESTTKTFKKRFDKKPSVVAWIEGMNLDKTHDLAFNVWVESVTLEHFSLRIGMPSLSVTNLTDPRVVEPYADQRDPRV